MFHLMIHDDGTAEYRRLATITTCIILGMGADATTRTLHDMTALHFVVSVEQVDILINHGADVNAQDDNGDTPLHVLHYNARKYSGPIAKRLLHHGADPHIKNKRNETPKILTTLQLH